MHALGADDVLDVIEWGCSHSVTSTALRLLARGTGRPEATLAALSLGERDRLLLALRESSVGGPLVARERCPHCEAELEVAFDAGRALGTGPAADGGEYSPAPAASRLEVTADDLAIRFRLPTSADLLAVEAFADEQAATRTLALRCIESITHAGAPAAEPALTPAALQALDVAMAQADPQADVRVALTCPDCAHAFERELDVAAFFIGELAGMSRTLLQEVGTLARGYGFSEAEILGMSPWRRQAYLGMLEA